MSDPKQKQETEKSKFDTAGEKVGGAISGIALYPFKLFDDLFQVSAAASSLKKYVCGCSNATETTSQATPTGSSKNAPQR